MVLLFVMMVMLCATDTISDIVLGLVRRSQPRVRLPRARQYRFN